MLVPDIVCTPPPGLAPWMKAAAKTSPRPLSRCEKLMIWSAAVVSSTAPLAQANGPPMALLQTAPTASELGSAAG